MTHHSHPDRFGFRFCLFSAVMIMIAFGDGRAAAAEPGSTATVDQIVFGDEQAEKSHDVVADHSEIVDGAFALHARQLLPLQPVSWDGGRIGFTMKVDPARPNYFTVKLWGGDAGEARGRLLLFFDGKQVGYRHIGDVDDLDIMSDDPRFAGRFFYTTMPLPRALTQGKTSVKLEIHGLGRIWGYGGTWDTFQKSFEQPSRGIYAGYTHTDPFFTPPAEEKQGAEPAAPIRKDEDPEVIEAVKERIHHEIDKMMTSNAPLNQMQMEFLARAWEVKWTGLWDNTKVTGRIVDSLDATYRAYLQDPKLAQSDKVTPNPDWFGLGPAGDTIRRLAQPLKPYLDMPVKGVAGIQRRAAWAKMLIDCRDWHREHRRLYSNQTMISDLYGIYLANRGVEVLEPSEAMSEPAVKRYLYESVGLQPWLGDDLPGGGSKKPMGDDYMQLTAKGLTRELGYVGAYGEVLDWVTSIYDDTRPSPDQPGDEQIGQQLIKIAKARAVFRYPSLDADGNRAMRLETTVGWRDAHFPGDVVYGQRTTWDASAFNSAAATRDPFLVGYAQQMLADNQYFSTLRDRMEDTSLRVTAGLLQAPDEYDAIRSLSPTGHRLPMSGEDDCAFADEEDGVIAVKHGSEILYASLYYRARFAINSLARVHYLMPTIERDATVWEEVQFTDSGMFFTRDGRRIETQTTRHEKSLPEIEQALEGEKLPIAKLPAAITDFRPGQENGFAGKGDFYRLRYGPYLIGMNMSQGKSFELKLPAGAPATAPDLISGKTMSLQSAIKVGPRSTVILYLPVAGAQ